FSTAPNPSSNCHSSVSCPLIPGAHVDASMIPDHIIILCARRGCPCAYEEARPGGRTDAQGRRQMKLGACRVRDDDSQDHNQPDSERGVVVYGLQNTFMVTNRSVRERQGPPPFSFFPCSFHFKSYGWFT